MTTRALVVGAGPAGLAAAEGLARWCDAVTVVETRRRGHAHKAGEHLPPQALSELDGLGLAGLLDGRHDRSPGVRSAWGPGGPVDKEYFLSSPGWGLNLRRDAFDEALARRAEARGVRLLFGARLRTLRRDADGYEATVRGRRGTRTLRAEVVVDASGRRAAAARELGATVRRYDDLVGVTGRLERSTLDEEAGRVQVESVADGWWYGVQLSDGTCLATLMTSASAVALYPGRASSLWRDRLRKSALLGPWADSGPALRVDVFDAATQRVEDLQWGDFLAVGDAAAAYDPLSSWGITKGLCDGHAAAEALRRQRSGEAGAVAEHRDAQQRDFEDFRSRQIEFYRTETRWPASPFWRARRGNWLLRAS